MTQLSVFVLWQSLVVGSYRSFFKKMADAPSLRVALAAPQAFREAANQLVACEDFSPPFHANDGRTPAYVLPAQTLHVQAVYFRGLTGALRQFFSTPTPQRVFLCVAEPYAPTALLALLAAAVAVRGRVLFCCYAAQNIVKQYAWPLRLIQAFVFKRAAAILVVGAEQEAVLRSHGYKGRTIPFPLWFDQALFNLGTRLESKSLTVGYAGGLTEAKGLHDLLSAFEADPTWGGARPALRIAGTGPLAPFAASACDRLRACGVDAQLVGALRTDAMPEFYRSLDILVVPSRTTSSWKEQFGRVIIEAMACGVVVIGSNSGEIAHVIGRPERIFAEADAKDLARVLTGELEALRDPAARGARRASEAERALQYSDSVLAAAFTKNLTELATQSSHAGCEKNWTKKTTKVLR